MMQKCTWLILPLFLIGSFTWAFGQEPPAKQKQEAKKEVAEKSAQKQPQKKVTQKKKSTKKAAAKKRASKQEAAKKDPPKKEVPKKEAPKKVTPKKEVPKKEAPKKVTPKKEVTTKEAPKKVAPKKEVPKKEAPKKVAPKKDPPAKEEPKKEPPKKEVPAKPAATQAEAKKEAPQPKPVLPTAWINSLNWRSIGPANMSGRIPALTVYEADPKIWWAATASGGLLKTVNNGTTFEHQFDHEATVSIGDVKVAQSDPSIVWVGTGEANPRNSVSWGDGVYKSTDGGKTWKNKGLKKTFQIGRLVIHPKDPNIVYVGALGRLWGPNEERGLYKTTDGGETWEKILYVDDKTGVIDVQMNPKNPDVLVVATYERQRDGFDGNDPAKKFGPGSGLYVTKDGGKTFKKATKGLPACNLGRIGISIYAKDPRHVYVVLESEKIGQVPEKAGYAGIRGENADLGARLVEVTADGPADKAGLKKGDIIFQLNGKTIHSYTALTKELDARQVGDKMKLTVSRDEKDVQVELVLRERPKPQERSQSSGRTMTPQDQARAGSKFAQSLGGQRENMIQGPDAYQYGGIYHSSDSGMTWKRINSLNPRPMYYSQIRIDPTDNKNIWVLGTSLYLSKDGGESFSRDNTARGIHVDHHSMWIDPEDGNHVILGNDGGIHLTYNQGLNWDHLNHVAIGQFYHVAVGPRRNYSVYGGLQDNGSWGAPNRGNDGRGAINSDWISIGGGDGFVCAVDPEDPFQIYSESQGGATGRYNLKTGERTSMRPRAPRGVRYRFNWKTPFLLSPHNSRIYYNAGNYVFRSPYKGNNLVAISPEITLTDKGSATALAESPREEGVLYVGTTDGALWSTTDGGQSWTNIYGKEDGTGEKEADESKTDDAVTDEAKPESEQDPESARDQERRGGRGVPGGTRGGPQGFIEMLRQQDANGDGKIQKSEMPERMAMMFERLDANSDGAVDNDELNAMAQRFQGRGGPGGQSGRGGRGGFGGRGRGGMPPGQGPAARPSRITPRSEPAKEESSEGEPAEEGEVIVEKDTVSGTWEGRFESENIPADRATLTLVLRMNPQGKIKVAYKSSMMNGEGDGKFDPKKNTMALAIDTERSSLDITGTVAGKELNGQIDVNSGAFVVPFKLTRTGDAPDVAADAAEAKTPPGKLLDEFLPGPRWVSSIEASRFKNGRVYVTCDGHRSNDVKPYVFVSEDYGKSWHSLLANLPNSIGSTRVIREDAENENVLYLGTEFSIWMSIDRGQSWTRLNSNLPTVAVHEIAVHPTAGEIVAGTHGRSLWILDVSGLRQLTAESIKADVSLYTPQPAIKWRSSPRRGSAGTRQFTGAAPVSGATIYYSLGKDARSVALKISDIEGKLLRELEGDVKAGLHSVNWDLRPVTQDRSSRSRRGGTVPSGKYLVTLIVDDNEFKKVLTVEDDPDA